VTLNQVAIESSPINNLIITHKLEPGQNKTWVVNVDDFFYGPVLSLKLDCDDCGEGKAITMKNRV
jgi:hypothetical protein